MSIYAEAVIFARAAHFGQYRRFTGESFVSHPVAVARYMKDFGFGSPVERAKAVLHDTVEDTEATHEQIQDRFGADIANSVFRLTDPSELDGGAGLTKREKLDRYGRHIQLGTRTDHNIKLCDILHNVPNMVACAKRDKAWSYVKEKKYFLKYLTKSDKVLYDHVYKMLIEQEAYLIAL